MSTDVTIHFEEFGNAPGPVTVFCMGDDPSSLADQLVKASEPYFRGAVQVSFDDALVVHPGENVVVSDDEQDYVGVVYRALRGDI